MTPQIKHRIAQIRRGEVPEGYKRTKVGIVPEEWKIKRLAQVLRKQTCKNTDNAIHNVLTNSATRGIVGQKDYFDKQIANSENTDNYYIVENGYFVYNPRISVSAHCGPFNKYYGCEKGIMSPLYTVYKYIDCSTDYTEYLSYFFSSANWHRYMNSIANYGARNDRMNVTSDTMSAMPLPYPPLFEQKKITEILQTQDKLIELQQKKIEELKKLKKAYLSKMFPKKGCNVPEIRFPGFTDPWEQRKLVNLCEKFTDGDWIEAKDQSNSGVRLIQTGNVGLGEYIDKPTNKKWISKETFERLNCEEVFAGDILISRLPEPAGRACIVPNLGTKMITAVDCTIIRTATQINSKYLLQYLSSQSYFDEVNTCLAGGTRQRISRSNLAAFDIPMPAKYEEQKAIGEFLRNIDHLITLHQRKLEEMKIYKKSLTQLLLTGIVRI